MNEATERPGDSAAVAAPAPSLVVDSHTGVDVALRIAGPGARAWAFLIDWHIRAVLALAWYIVGALLYNRGWSLAPPFERDAVWFVFVLAPTAAIYTLYHFVLEIAMRGRTPGKRWAGVRLVTREGAAPSVGAHLTRNVFRLIDSFPLFYGVGLVCTIVTRDHVRVGDLAAGTLLVYERTDAALPPVVESAVTAGTLDPERAEVVNELLQRWNELSTDARRRLATAVLGEEVGPDVEDEQLRARLERFVRGESV